MRDDVDLTDVVPAVIAAMDNLCLGNRLSMLSMAGMVAIVIGVMLVFRKGQAGR